MQGKRILFLRQKLQPIIAGASTVYIENYSVNASTIKGCDTNFFVRSVPISLAAEAGVPVHDIKVQSWRKTFKGDARNALFNALRTPTFFPDTTTDAIKNGDAIDAVCIGLHSLMERGFSLAVRSLSAM